MSTTAPVAGRLAVGGTWLPPRADFNHLAAHQKGSAIRHARRLLHAVRYHNNRITLFQFK